MSIPAGWYPNPDGSPTRRWWNGLGWGDEVSAEAAAQPYTATALRAPEGTSGSTWQFWLFAAILLLGFVQYLVYNPASAISAIIDADPSAPNAALAIFTPGYFALIGISFVAWGASVLVAYLDYRELVRRGVPRPFHWAWTFLSSIVYVIGRAVVCGRRGAPGSRGPVILYFAIYAASLITSFVVVSIVMRDVFESIYSRYQ